MNIFYLHHDPRLAAQDHCDKHVGKMLLEGFQLLSTAHHEWNSHLADQVYKVSHRNHPSSIWCRQTKENYFWLYDLCYHLNQEFRRRRGKDHLSWTKLSDILRHAPADMPSTGFTQPPQAMPDEYKHECSIHAYRTYYRQDKSRFAKWEWGNDRNYTPLWWNDPEYNEARQELSANS